MAELLTANGLVKPGSPGAYLRETLPEEYYVIVDPMVAGQHLAAIIVGHTGLFAIEDEDDGTADEVASAGGRHASSGNGASGSSEERTIRAVRRFLRDEFPGLTPPVCVLSALRDWASDVATWRVMRPREWIDQPLAETVLAADAETFRFESEAARAALAIGFRDRQLTITQPASKPFVFRTGRAMRVGSRVTTIRDAVIHMDRNPADGMHHLRDGTLATWLEEEGGYHLAALARDIMRQPRTDMRVALETFLIGTGLVARPRLAFKPEVLSLGYAAQGQKVSGLLRLRKPRGRGHLFGELSTADPWLKVEPREFQGAPAEVVVSAETTSLSIGMGPCESEVVVSSSASSEPIAIPVSVRIVALPGSFVRWVLRPLAALLAGLPIGLGIGAWWEVMGVGSGRVVVGLWPVLVGGLWAYAGLIRGLRQPPAWPAWYALKRWLLRALLWSTGLAVFGSLLVLAWRNGLGGGLDIPGLTLPVAAAIGAAFGVGPATLDELANSRHATNAEYVQGRASRRRAMIISSGVMVLVLSSLLAPRFIAPVVRGLRSDAAYAPARAWVAERWQELNTTVDRIMDELTLLYYDRPGDAKEPEAPHLKLPAWLGGD